MELIRFAGFELVHDNLIKLQEEYKKYNDLIRHNFGFFVFPDSMFKDILINVEKINKNLRNKKNIENKYIKEDYDLLSPKIYDFCAKIKDSTFDNLIFGKIKSNISELLDYFQNIDLTMGKIKGIDDSMDENLCNIEDPNNNRENNNLYNSLMSQNQEEKNNNNSDFKYNSQIQIDFSDLDMKEEIEKDDYEFINENFYAKYQEIKDKYKYKLYYANMIIKEEKFNEEKLISIKHNFPDCEILFNFKIIQNEFIRKQCKISRYP